MLSYKIFKGLLPCIVILYSIRVFSFEKTRYHRIISLSPAITRILYEIGVEHRVIGITLHCPKGTTKKHILGTILEPNIEKIILLKPDLIILSKEFHNKQMEAKLRKFGFHVYVVDISYSFNDLCKNYCLLATKLDRSKIAQQIIQQARLTINNVYNKTRFYSITKKKTFFWEIGRYPLYTAGRKSLVNDYNYYSNTLNIYHDIRQSYFPVMIEDIIKRNPDIIIHTKYNNDILDTFWTQYKNIINAVTNSKIFIIDNNDIFSPTPLTFTKSLIILIKKIMVSTL